MTRVFAELPELGLQGLADGDARALLMDNLLGPLDTAVCDQIVAESHGNPLALFELPRTWDQSGARRRFRAARQPGGRRPHRAELCPAPPPAARRHPAARPRRGGRADRGSGAAPSRRRGPRHRHGGEPPGGRRRSPEGRCSRRVHAPARAVGRLSIGAGRGPPPRAPRPRRRNGRGDRSRPAGLASRPRHAADQRRGGRGAGTVRRPGAGARRRRCGGGVPPAGRRPDRRSRRVAATGRWRPPRPASRPAPSTPPSACWRRREAAPIDAFQRARVDLVRAQVAFASGFGGDAPPMLLTAARGLEPFDLDLARETYLAAWGAAEMAGSVAGPGRPPRDLPRRPGPPTAERSHTSARPARRRPRAADHRRPRCGRTDVAARRERADHAAARRHPAVGVDGDVRQHPRVGHRELPCHLVTAGAGRARRRRGRPAAPAPLAAGPAEHVDGRPGRRRVAGSRERERRHGDRRSHPAVHPAAGAGAARAGGGLRRARRQRVGAGHRQPSRHLDEPALGGGGALQRARTLRRGRGGGPRGRRRHRHPPPGDVGAARARRGGRAGRRHRAGPGRARPG